MTIRIITTLIRQRERERESESEESRGDEAVYIHLQKAY